MKSSKHIALLLVTVGSVAITACNTDLAITDPNNPTTERAISNSGDVQALIGGSINAWYDGSENDSPGPAFAVMADAFTASFGNFGMRFNSNEPRIAYDNLSSSGDAVVANDPWRYNYGALGQANDGLAAIGRGVKITDGTDDVTDEYQAIGYFVQGATLGDIALIFDKGFLIDETTPIPAPATFSPYADISAAAVARLDKAIALSDGKTWTIPETYTTAIDMTAAKFNELANTMAARILAYTPRTAAENDAVDWNRVAAYARKGISQGGVTYDFAPIGDYRNWYSEGGAYYDRPSWMRVDMRVIKEMDPTQPVEFASCEAVPPKATSADSRLTTDFTYHDDIPFDAARGCYHFSNWAHSRYFSYTYDAPSPWETGPYPMILASENDLLLAEADVRSGGDLGEAATLINKTRVGRGHLPPVSAGTGTAGLLKAIQYEQDIELLATGSGLQYYDRRRIDGLQPETPLHLPVPAHELETDGLPIYTFGGPDHPDH